MTIDVIHECSPIIVHGLADDFSYDIFVLHCDRDLESLE